MRARLPALERTTRRMPETTTSSDASEVADDPSQPQTRSWREIVRPYARPDTWRGVAQLLNTGPPFLALMGLMLYALDHGWWAALFLAVPAAGLLVRLFTIQHDCGHGSFFKSRRANDLIGRAI